MLPRVYDGTSILGTNVPRSTLGNVQDRDERCLNSAKSCPDGAQACTNSVHQGAGINGVAAGPRHGGRMSQTRLARFAFRPAARASNACLVPPISAVAEMFKHILDMLYTVRRCSICATGHAQNTARMVILTKGGMTRCAPGPTAT